VDLVLLAPAVSFCIPVPMVLGEKAYNTVKWLLSLEISLGLVPMVPFSCSFTEVSPQKCLLSAVCLEV
jgi:hypothetical protein